MVPRPAVIVYVPTGLAAVSLLVRLGAPVTPLSPMVSPLTKPVIVSLYAGSDAP